MAQEEEAASDNSLPLRKLEQFIRSGTFDVTEYDALVEEIIASNNINAIGAVFFLGLHSKRNEIRGVFQRKLEAMARKQGPNPETSLYAQVRTYLQKSGMQITIGDERGYTNLNIQRVAGL